MVHFYWKASIISNLSASLPSIPFRSLGDFLYTDFQITTIKDSSYQDLFEKADTKTLKAAWETKFLDKSKSLVTGMDDMIPLVLTGQYAMFEVLSSIQTLEEYNECKITDAGFFINKMNFAFTLQKDSQYTELFNEAMRKMVEHGTLQRILVKNQPPKPSCDAKKKGIPLGLPNIAFSFTILITGGCLSVTVFLFEQVRQKCLRLLLGLAFLIAFILLTPYYYEDDSR